MAALRAARAEAGFNPDTGIVSLMLHTFVGPNEHGVRQQVRGPLQNYLRTSLNLLKKYASAFPIFQQTQGASPGEGDEFSSLTADEQDAVLEHAFERYFETSGLFGSTDRCLAMIERLKAAAQNAGIFAIAGTADPDLILQSIDRKSVV